MEGRKLLQYLIDISDVALPKKQEATEYLSKLEEIARGYQRKCTHETAKLDDKICPNCLKWIG